MLKAEISPVVVPTHLFPDCDFWLGIARTSGRLWDNGLGEVAVGLTIEQLRDLYAECSAAIQSYEQARAVAR